MSNSPTRFMGWPFFKRCLSNKTVEEEEEEEELTMNVLPDEILLFIFRKLSANEFMATVPSVCKRWSKIIASDSHTIKKIAMFHYNPTVMVDFFYLKSNCEQRILFSLPEFCNELTLPSRLLYIFTKKLIIAQNVHYETAFYLSTKYKGIFGQIKTLMITHNLDVYQTNGFTCVDNLTTIIFYQVRIRVKDCYTMLEMGKVYSNVRNVTYNKCSFQMELDKKCLHSGFKRLKRFRLDHYSINHWDLEDLLKIHPKLEEIVFDKCCSTNINDRWIEILMDRLKGRTVKSLSLHSSYFSTECTNRLLTSKLIVDKSKVNVGAEIVEFPFSITIESG